jgi:hypothetical protein
MTCPLRTFPLFNFITIILHTVNALLPHFEDRLNDLKRKLHFERHSQRAL